MRISTSTIFARGLAGMQSQTAELFRAQQQISSGKRILTPADDPVAAARVLDVGQSKAINTQFTTNQGAAQDNLRLLEGRLTGAADVLQYARERAVQAGNASLAPSDLKAIATDIRAQYDGLLGIANSQDSNGEYLFAGYKSQVQPFEGNIAGVSYAGDQGVRTIQVSSSRSMPITQPGSDIFENTRTIDNTAISVVAANGNSSGVGLNVTFAPPSSPVNPSFTGRRYDVSFNAGNFTVTERQPGGAQTSTVVPGPAPITVNGLEIDVTGAVSNGDTFEVFVASKSVFKNVALFVDALERPGPANTADGAVAFALKNLDAGLDSVIRARTTVGSNLVEIENLQNIGADVDVQYSETISRLEDVDLAEAISRLTRNQTFLEAAQQSYLRITNLSLFNFLN